MKNYKWNEECLVLDGYIRSCVYDLTRQKTYYIDKTAKSLIQKIEGLDSTEIENSLDETELEWFNFFVDKEFMFEVPHSQMKNFRPIELGWNHSSKIVSAIVESSTYLPKVLPFLNELNCHHIVVSFENSNEIGETLQNCFKTTFLKSLDIIVKRNEHTNEYYKSLLAEIPVLCDIYIQDSMERIVLSAENSFGRVLNVAPLTHNSLTFSVEINIFMEAHFNNVYLNRKLFVDKNGNLFNTPESSIKLGNMDDFRSSEELYSSSQTQEWNSTKQNTSVCEDCELRGMCIDNRIPVYNEKRHKWYHQTECDYNPYIGLWKSEEGYLPLKSCGIESDISELKIDKIKLNSINEVLWEVN